MNSPLKLKMSSLTRYYFYFVVTANFLRLYEAYVQDLLNDAIRSGNVTHVAEMLGHKKPEYFEVSALIPDSHGDQPMEVAINIDNHLMTGILLYFGADLRAKVPSCDYGCNLFLHAVKSNRVALVDQFLNFDRYLATTTDDYYDNCLHYSAFNDFPNMVKTILKHNPPLNAVDMEGKTALHYACVHGSLQIVNELLKAGVIVNVKDISHHTAMYYVPDNRDGMVINDVLRRHGAFVQEYPFSGHNRKLLQFDSEERMIDDNFKLSEDKRAWLIGSLAETFGTKKKNISNFLYSNYCRNVKLYE